MLRPRDFRMVRLVRSVRAESSSRASPVYRDATAGADEVLSAIPIEVRDDDVRPRRAALDEAWRDDLESACSM